MKKIIFLFLVAVIFWGTSFNLSQAAYSSQCTTTNSDGSQSNCTHDNDADILSEQCVDYYTPATCSSMAGYLSAMAADCNNNSGGVDCDLIISGGYYGAAASAYASYLESSSGSDSGSSLGSGVLNMPSGFGLPDPAGGIVEIAANLLNWLLGIVGMIAIIAFAVSGFQYFIAAGDETAAESAKKNMTYSILGVIAALSGFVIIRAVDALLNAFSF